MQKSRLETTKRWDPLTLQTQSSPAIGAHFLHVTAKLLIILLPGKHPRSGYIKSPVSTHFCTSTDVYIRPHHFNAKNCIHSGCPNVPETLTTLSVPFCTKTTIVSAGWLGKAKCSVNLNATAHSRVDLSFFDPLKSPCSKRWSFLCQWRGSCFQTNKINIPTPFYTYSRVINTTVKPQ